MKITFIYDIASPNAYLCHRVIPEFEKKHNVEIEYFPCLLGGIFKLTNNQPPWMAFAEITNKSGYMNIEMDRFMKFHKISEFKLNPHFPINTVTIQRGLLAAKKLDCEKEYIDVVAKGMWEEEVNLGDKEILEEFLTKKSLPGKDILELTSDDQIKQQLIENTQKAVDAGVFGVPTFILNEEVFFGKEALREIPDFL